MANDRITHGSQEISGRGYILDEPYIARFYDLQTPARMAYSIRCAGFGQRTAEGRFRYCELGCGNGVTVALLAALHPEAQFVGIDLNPDHVENARELAASAGLTNITFLRADFVEAAAEGFEPFDFITVHGVYSWVDGPTQDTMFAFIERFLSPEGIAYISYNAFPGWSAKEPIWRLLNRYSKRVDGNSVAKIEEGLRFLDFLSGSDAPYFTENPAAREHLEFLKSEDLHYVSHEFCNDNFAPVYCSEIFAHAARYGLQFVAQAETVSNLSFERVPQQFRAFIESMTDAMEQEVWSSLLRNDFFRTDLFARTLPERRPLEASELWGKAFTLITPRADLPETLSCGSRELSIKDPLIAALIERADEAPQPLDAVCRHSDLQRYSPRMLLETAQLLELSGHFAFLLRLPATMSDGVGERWHFADPAFAPLLQARIFENAGGYLAAPNLGSAIRFELMNALALLALDGKTPQEAASGFAHTLNTEAPDLMRYVVSADWAEGYLTDFNRGWQRILTRLGSVTTSAR